jgi:hypothetical protein
VKRPSVTAATLAALGAVPLVVIILVLPGERSRALDVYVVFLGAVVMYALARMTAGPRRARRPISPGKETQPPQLPALARVEREVILATGSGFDRQIRLKPLVSDIVRHRLWTERGIELDSEPDRAREALDPELWTVVRPGPPDPNARWIRGLNIADLTRIVDEIDRI